MKTLLPTSFLTGLALLTLTAAPAFAAISVTLPTATVPGSMVITQDIDFTITAAGSVAILCFDEWVTSDGSNSGIVSTSLSPLIYSLNSGSLSSAPVSFIIDNFDSSAGALTANDGYLFLKPGIAVGVGNLFSVKAATYALPAGSMQPGYNPQTQQTFTGEAFLTASNGVRLSANTPVGAAVPEPGSMGLLALGGLASLARRRRPARI